MHGGNWLVAAGMAGLGIATVAGAGLDERALVRFEAAQMRAKVAAMGVAEKTAAERCIATPCLYDEAGLTWDGMAVWIVCDNDTNSAIRRLNATTGDILFSMLPPGDGPNGLAFDGQNLWHADFLQDRLYQINPANGAIIRYIPAPEGITSDLAWDGQYLWVAEWGYNDRIYKVNPQNGAIVHSIPMPNPDMSLCGLTWDGDSLRVTSWKDDGVFDLNPTTGAIIGFMADTHVGRGAAWDSGYLWLDRHAEGVCRALATGSPWGSTVDVGDGWKWSSWFGYFYAAFDPWVYHAQHGWLYRIGEAPESLWFWDQGMQKFWWTSRTAYSYLYRPADGQWLWYMNGTVNPRAFLVPATGTWEKY